MFQEHFFSFSHKKWVQNSYITCTVIYQWKILSIIHTWLQSGLAYLMKKEMKIITWGTIILLLEKEKLLYSHYIYIYFLPWCHPLMWIVEDEMGNFSYHVSGIGLEEATPDKAIMSSTQPPLFQKCPRTCTKYFI